MTRDTPPTQPTGSEGTAFNSACYVYGIVPADVCLDRLDGLDGMGNGIVLVADGPVAALVEAIDPDRPLGRRRHLVTHTTVLNEVAECHPVLPMRFGSVLDSRSSVVAELLRPRLEHFESLLQRVAGKHQFNVRARYVLDRVLAEVVASGSEVRGRREQTRERPEDATHHQRIRLGERSARAVEARRVRDGREILERLSAHVHGYVVKDVSGMDSIAEFSFAVTDDERARFEAEAQALAQDMDGLARICLVGPMALYDFVPED